MTLSTRRAWSAYFEDVGLPEDLVRQYTEYASRLLRARVPVVFEVEHLSQLMGVTRDFLVSVESASGYHYRKFELKKRSGGTRMIEAPRSALKQAQRWILYNVLAKVPIHRAAKGFARGISIRDHGEVHLGASRILRMDFADFFPSIRKGRVISLFSALGYSEAVSRCLAALCCLDGRLPQGAPTSPAVSNIVCLRFDQRLAALCEKYGWSYSRYADDVAISGDGLRFSLVRFIERIANSEGFTIRPEKTRLFVEGSRKCLTGLIVGGDKLRVPRDFKRKVAQEVYYVSKFGSLSHQAKTRRREPFLLDKLRGQLAFWLFIEPECERALRLRSSLESLGQ